MIELLFIYVYIYFSKYVRVLSYVSISVGFPAIATIGTAKLDNNADAKAWLTVIGSLALLTSFVEFSIGNMPGY